MPVEEELKELLDLHAGLKIDNSELLIVTGVLAFEASYDQLEEISDWFELEISIPNGYPKVLPIVKEISGKLDINYRHLNESGSFCLAAPLEVKRIFSDQPTLAGFVDNLVIPFLYSYCYWRKYNLMPFGELSHYGEGIVEYYLEQFGVTDKKEITVGLCKIYKYGYRGHHDCPCGSGKIIRKCHKETVWEISQYFTKQELASDLVMMLDSIKDSE